MTVTAETSVLIGLIGTGIQASRAPRMHEAEATAWGVKLIYKLIDLTVLRLGVEALPDLLVATERMGFAGLNITHPCKQVVLPLLHDLPDDARALGAVNTVILRNGKRVGHNTDWYGFSEAMARDLADAPRDLVMQFGAGGGRASRWPMPPRCAGSNTLSSPISCRPAPPPWPPLCASASARRSGRGGD